MLKFERFERVSGGGAFAWKVSAWAGGDFDRALLRSEGERADGGIDRADAELLWNHAIAAFWNTELGVRRDFGQGADRQWIAFGVSGLAPYGIELGATGYLGGAGRSAVRVELDYEVVLTQRLILQPRLELDAYGRDDAAARTGSGLSDAAFGLRLRYEIRREFAPYVGVEWSRRFGRSADYAQADGHGSRDAQLVAGVRFWY
jgi:copper resistance protein B